MGFYTDKVVIVTGASSGIGLASARLFAAEGANVVIAARSADKLAEIEAEINSAGHTAFAVATDVQKEEDCAKLISATVEKFGRIDVLVNNAGVSMRALFRDLDLSVLRRSMDVNYWGTVCCTKYALPYLLKSKGSLVGVVSIAGFIGMPGRTGYSSSKFAMMGFLSALRVEHLYDGLHVMILAPGFTASNVRNAAMTADGSPQGHTPRNEGKMMSAEKCAGYLLKGIRKHKRMVVLTPLGKATFIINKMFPRLVDRIDYDMMAAEPDSPLSKH